MYILLSLRLGPHMLQRPRHGDSLILFTKQLPFLGGPIFSLILTTGHEIGHKPAIYRWQPFH